MIACAVEGKSLGKHICQMWNKRHQKKPDLARITFSWLETFLDKSTKYTILPFQSQSCLNLCFCQEKKKHHKKSSGLPHIVGLLYFFGLMSGFSCKFGILLLFLLLETVKGGKVCALKTSHVWLLGFLKSFIKAKGQ